MRTPQISVESSAGLSMRSLRGENGMPPRDVDGYVAPLCCRCTCVSAALSSGDDRGLESGYADSGLGG